MELKLGTVCDMVFIMQPTEEEEKKPYIFHCGSFQLGVRGHIE